MKYTLKKTEQIPHLDEAGNILQMICHSVTVEVAGEEGETLDEVTKELEVAFEKQIESIGNQNPQIKKKNLQISFLLKELKSRIKDGIEYNSIVAKAKNLEFKQQ